MANEYYERLSEMNPGDLADGLAMEAEFNAIAQGFSKLPTPHTGGQGFDGPVRVGDATSDDEAASLGQVKAAIGEAVLLPIATYGNLSAAEWETLPSNTYLLFGTGAQFSNTPYTLVAESTYCLQVRHVIGGEGVAIYHDQLSLASTDDASNIDLRRLFVRTDATFDGAVSGGWVGFAMKKAALTALESLTPTADRLAYYTGAGVASLTELTAFARTMLNDVSAKDVRNTIEAYGKDNIIGTVSQVGGVNTGAIVEIGSNANGSYIKYAGGLMVAFANLELAGFSINVAIGNGGTYQSSGAVTVIYPASFVSAVRSFSEVLYYSGGARPWTTITSQLTDRSLYVLTAGVSMSSFSGMIYVGVIGRWY